MSTHLRLASLAVFALAICSTPALARNGTHTRLQTEQGPVHVWTPASYDRDTAGIVVYVHGYYTTVDRAWRQHRLAKQFAASGVNALFIACAAPKGPDDDVAWPSLQSLLDELVVQLDVSLPEGRLVAVGHSGAHRTLSRWLDERGLVDTLVLVDAVYGDAPELRDWLAADDEHRLIDTAALTRRWTEPLHAELADTLVFDKFPRSGKLPGARDARVVYVRSQYDHMRLVTGGVALPILLRALRLPPVDARERSLDLGAARAPKSRRAPAPT